MILNRNFQKHLETINTILSLNADKYIPLSLRAENISFAFERKNEHYFLKPLNDQYMMSIANNWDEINFNGTIFDLAEGNEGGVLEISCQSDRILNSKGQTDERGVQF